MHGGTPDAEPVGAASAAVLTPSYNEFHGGVGKGLPLQLLFRA